MNRSNRRSRSRSRTPPVRAKPKKVVNMLDSSAITEAKEVRRKPISERVTGGPPFTPKPTEEGAVERERITCTIEGSGTRRTIFNRVSGGRFEDGGRFGNNNRSFDGNRSFEGGNRGGGGGGRFDGNRSFNGGFNDRRVDVTGDGQRRAFPDRRSFGDRALKDDDEEFRRGREDADKPVMKLVDPQEVPRSNRFFTHDDRGGDNHEWRGRDMYDPRKDTGRSYDRNRFDRDRRDRDFGNNRRFDRDDRGGGDRRSGGIGGGAAVGGGGWDGFSRQNNVNGYTGSRFGEKSAADGVWVHDKYLELTDDEDEAKKAANEDVLVIHEGDSERKVE